MEIELIDEEYSYANTSLVDFLQTNTPSGWKEFFSQEEVKKYLQDTSDKLIELGKKEVIFPSIQNIFRAFYLVPMDKIKVVILGQDPYHNGSAVGLAFSVKEGQAINPSLRNIKEEVSECGFKVDKDKGDLTCWAKQGVFLINTSLTVKESSAGSHLLLWNKFTQELIKYITRNCNDLVFLLWGEKAQLYKKYFVGSHIILETSHPSPFSVYRGFSGSKCFSEANLKLRSLKKEEINWSI